MKIITTVERELKIPVIATVSSSAFCVVKNEVTTCGDTCSEIACSECVLSMDNFAHVLKILKIACEE